MDVGNSHCGISLELVLSDIQKEVLSKKAIEDSPNEACAILFGQKEKERFLVKDVFLAKNIEESPVNFTISNEQLIEGYQEAEKRNLDVIGIFHSHPESDPHPSSTDKKFMETNPVVWLIFSGISKNFKAYFLDSDLLEIPIVDF